MKNIFFTIVCSFHFLFLSYCDQKVEDVKKPNLLYVFTDQQSYDMLGCYGNSQIKTPNIDKLASQGIKFNQCISNCPLCTPYRGILLTGQHALHTGALYNDLRIIAGEGNYFAEVLRDAGYRMGYIGKWHLYGGNRNRPIPKGEFRYGFDEIFWTNNCTLDYSPENSFYWNEDSTRVNFGDWEQYGQAKQAIDFIDKNANEPFALFLSWHPPHNWKDRYRAPEEFMRLYDLNSIKLRPSCKDTRQVRQMYQGYMALVSSIDEAFGWLTDKLMEKGIFENTIVVFTSDHGDVLTSYNQKFHKSIPQSLSSRVPLIISYPDKLRPGDSDLLVGALDLMPTILGLMDIQIPSSCQGRNLASYILNGDESAVVSIPTYHMRHNWRGIYTKRYTYSFSVDTSEYFSYDVINCLYDREKDPNELNNLFNDPQYSQVKRGLHEKTLKWMKIFNDKGLSWEQIAPKVLSEKDLMLEQKEKLNSKDQGILKGRPIDLIY